MILAPVIYLKQLNLARCRFTATLVSYCFSWASSYLMRFRSSKSLLAVSLGNKILCLFHYQRINKHLILSLILHVFSCASWSSKSRWVKINPYPCDIAAIQCKLSPAHGISVRNTEFSDIPTESKRICKSPCDQIISNSICLLLLFLLLFWNLIHAVSVTPTVVSNVYDETDRLCDLIWTFLLWQ